MSTSIQSQIIKALGKENCPLPDKCKPLTIQVAGHRHGQGKFGVGILQHEDGNIWKPVLPNSTTEDTFYFEVFQKEVKALKPIRNFLPVFLGVCEPSGNVQFPYIVLENILTKFHQPSLLDIKIGKTTYSPDATESKIHRELTKFPLRHEVGFQLSGMRVVEGDGDVRHYDVKFGRSFTKSSVVNGVRVFVPGRSNRKAHVVRHFLGKLNSLLGWFEGQHSYQFYASSLLLVYEGNLRDDDVDYNLVDLRMIDFAHVYHHHHADENYMYGLRQLIAHFEEVLLDCNE